MATKTRRARKRASSSLTSITAAANAARFALDVWSVVGLRMAKLAAGGPAAVLEGHRMVAEKVAAAWEAQTVAAVSLMTGGSQRRARHKADAVYRRHVRANRRRLTGK